MPPRSAKFIVVSTESRTTVPPPAPANANVPSTESIRLVDIQFERNSCLPTELIVRFATVTFAESSMEESASPMTTLDAALGAPAAPASAVAHIAESDQVPAPPFQV